MSDQAASALGNITGWAWAWYVIGAIAAAGLAGYVLVLIALWWRDVAVIAVQLARFHVRRRKLLGAISKIEGAQRLKPAWTDPSGNGNWIDEDGAFHSTGLREATGQPTRPMSIGDLVIHPEIERYAAYLASRLTEAIDPDDCTWCVDLGWQWPCTCASRCGDPACVAGVRRG